jgi:hypothetical protein
MKRIFKGYQKSAFFVNTIGFILLLSFMPINDIIEENKHNFFETIRITQLIAVFSIALFFYFRVFKKSDNSNAFYSTDKFYCDLMYLTVLVGISFTIHFINWETTDVHSAIKVWEISAYAVTLIYTFWLWIFNIGSNLIDIIENKYSSDNKKEINEKYKLIGAVILSLLTLIIITIGHLTITFYHNNKFSIQISVVLITITYFLFVYIAKRMVNLTEKNLENSKNDDKINEINKKIDEYQHEFKFGLKYMDNPMKWVFVIMVIYAGYATSLDVLWDKHTMEKLEMFFGGAIAFELLLSSFVWAKNN